MLVVARDAVPQPDEMETVIKPMKPEHWEAVRAIYLAGIATGEATFETAAPNWANWNQWHLPAPRLVALFRRSCSRVGGFEPCLVARRLRWRGGGERLR